MNEVELPESMLIKLGSEMKMDVHWIDVKCANEKKYYRLVVRGGRFITGFTTDFNGVGELPFSSSDIVNIRRQAARWWPFW